MALNNDDYYEVYNKFINIFKNKIIQLSHLEIKDISDNFGFLILSLINHKKYYPKIYINIKQKKIIIGLIFDKSSDDEKLYDIIFKNNILKNILNLNKEYHTKLSYLIPFDDKYIITDIMSYFSNNLDSTTLYKMIDIFKLYKYNKNYYDVFFYLIEINIYDDDIEIESVIKDIYNIFLIFIGATSTASIQDKKKEYREFVTLLNESRYKNLISAELRREYDKMWKNDEFIRDELKTKIKKMLNMY